MKYKYPIGTKIKYIGNGQQGIDKKAILEVIEHRIVNKQKLYELSCSNPEYIIGRFAWWVDNVNNFIPVEIDWRGEFQ